LLLIRRWKPQNKNIWIFKILAQVKMAEKAKGLPQIGCKTGPWPERSGFTERKS
jgi:hypothetical protein